MMKPFVDTTVLLYSAREDPIGDGKGIRATEILSAYECVLSVQVLQEFYWQATRAKRSDRLSHTEAMDYVAGFSLGPVQPMTLEILNAALETCHRYRISYWDAAIVEAARAMGCDTVLSEDLQHGQDFGGVRVVNPFLPQG